MLCVLRSPRAAAPSNCTPRRELTAVFQLPGAPMGSTTTTTTAANMQAALDEAGKVVKKQRLCAAKVGDAVQQLLDAATAARDAVASGATSAQAAVGQLQAQVQQLGLVQDMTSSTKDLHSAISKLSKVRGLWSRGTAVKRGGARHEVQQDRCAVFLLQDAAGRYSGRMLALHRQTTPLSPLCCAVSRRRWTRPWTRSRTSAAA